MTYPPAPYFSDIDVGRSECSAWWLKTPDGARIRIVQWAAGGKGTILLFNGRTEYAEKYGEAADEFTRHGYTFATLDWRGQGLSDRRTSDRFMCHIGDFSEFQIDADTALDALRVIGSPEPFFLVGHSMGGCIGLRLLHRGADIRAAAFSAPMWRIYLNRIARRVAAVGSELAVRLGQHKRYVPGASHKNYIHFANPVKNRLTSDTERFSLLKRQIGVHPELSTGGPSYGWIHAALRECHKLIELPPPTYPVYVAFGADDRIVDPKAVRIICADWPECDLEVLPDARHELLMERREIRKHIIERSAAFFDTHL